MWKAAINLITSICPSVPWNNSSTRRWIFTKFDIWVFFESLLKNSSFIKSDKDNGTLHDDFCKFVTACRLVLYRIWNFRTHLCSIVFLFSSFPFLLFSFSHFLLFSSFSLFLFFPLSLFLSSSFLFFSFLSFLFFYLNRAVCEIMWKKYGRHEQNHRWQYNSGHALSNLDN
jgi:hypothetical protein